MLCRDICSNSRRSNMHPAPHRGAACNLSGFTRGPFNSHSALLIVAMIVAIRLVPAPAISHVAPATLAVAALILKKPVAGGAKSQSVTFAVTDEVSRVDYRWRERVDRVSRGFPGPGQRQRGDSPSRIAHWYAIVEPVDSLPGGSLAMSQWPQHCRKR